MILILLLLFLFFSKIWYVYFIIKIIISIFDFKLLLNILKDLIIFNGIKIKNIKKRDFLINKINIYR